MGGQRRNRLRFKAKKNHKKGHRVNDPATYRNKRKRTAAFHSIKEDLEDDIVVPDWYLALVRD